ncbi:MAG: hypothetical protein JXA69_05540 [Phycisphaerae bacterium]|nr:hypothetical protein [Phycisphaerae bacterium]
MAMAFRSDPGDEIDGAPADAESIRRILDDHAHGVEHAVGILREEEFAKMINRLKENGHLDFADLVQAQSTQWRQDGRFGVESSAYVTQDILSLFRLYANANKSI